MILAAGFGTRLKPFTNRFPKPLVPVCGIPLLLYTLAFLKKNRITEIVINLHHHGDKIKTLLGNGRRLGLRIRYSREPKILGTGGGIKKALSFLSKEFLVINGDVIVDWNLQKLIDTHCEKKPLATLVLYKHPQARRYGLVTSRNEKVLSILDWPKLKRGDLQGLFSGIHLLSRDRLCPFFKPFTKGKGFCIVRDVYMPALKQGKSLGAAQLKGFWRVQDCREDLLQTQRDLLKTRLSYRKILQDMVAVLQKKPLYGRIIASFE